MGRARAALLLLAALAAAALPSALAGIDQEFFVRASGAPSARAPQVAITGADACADECMRRPGFCRAFSFAVDEGCVFYPAPCERAYDPLRALYVRYGECAPTQPREIAPAAASDLDHEYLGAVPPERCAALNGTRIGDHCWAHPVGESGVGEYVASEFVPAAAAEVFRAPSYRDCRAACDRRGAAACRGYSHQAGLCALFGPAPAPLVANTLARAYWRPPSWKAIHGLAVPAWLTPSRMEATVPTSPQCINPGEVNEVCSYSGEMYAPPNSLYPASHFGITSKTGSRTSCARECAGERGRTSCGAATYSPATYEDCYFATQCAAVWTQERPAGCTDGTCKLFSPLIRKVCAAGANPTPTPTPLVERPRAGGAFECPPEARELQGGLATAGSCITRCVEGRGEACRAVVYDTSNGMCSFCTSCLNPIAAAARPSTETYYERTICFPTTGSGGAPAARAAPLALALALGAALALAL